MPTIDPLFTSVRLLAHMEGSNGSTSITDVTGRTITRVGSPAISTAQAKFGGSSLSLTTGDYLQIADATELKYSGGVWTFEFWLYLPADASGSIALASKSPGWHLDIRSNQAWGAVFYREPTSSNFADGFIAANKANLGAWNHIAVVSTGTQVHVFTNGAKDTYTPGGGFPDNASPFEIGKGFYTADHPQIYLDDVRITIGEARYTAAFTVPSEAFPDTGTLPDVITVDVSAPSPTLLAWCGGSATLATSAPTLSALGGGIGAALAAPSPRLSAAARSSLGDNDFTYTAPSPTLSFYTGGSAKLKAPSPALSITATAVNFGHAALSAPTPALAATGTVSGTAYANLTFGYINGGSYDLEAYGGGIGAALAAPRAALTAAVTAGAVGKVSASAPRPTLSAFSGAAAAVVAPAGMLVASATKHALARAALSAPRPALSAFSGASAEIVPAAGVLVASATPGGLASAAIAPPAASLVGYGGAVISITLAGRAELTASGVTGAAGKAAITAPLFELTASGTAQNYGSALLTAPSGRLGGTARAWLMAPSATLTALGSAVVTATYEAYAVNLNHTPKRGVEPVDEATHYTNFPFTHVVRYQNSYFGANATGLYLLEGTTDDGAGISYAVKTATSDLDSPNQKTVASAYFSGRLGPEATVTLYAGEGAGVPYAYTTPRGALAQNHREVFGKGIKQHRYYALGLSGSDVLELDNVELDVKQMNRRI